MSTEKKIVTEQHVAPKPVRMSLQSLRREFKRCSDRYPPLYHDLFGPRPDLSEYDVQDVCESFRQAFGDRFNDPWEEWHGPDDVSYFGRFFGSSEGVEELKKLAECAYLTVCKIGSTEPNFKNFVYPPEHGYHGWLKLLNDMAYGYPTTLLRCDFGIWGDSDQTDMQDEELERIGTPEDGAPYPLHPFHWQLAPSVFTCSMAAIDLILDDDSSVLVGEWTWGLPVSFSRNSDEHELVTPNTDAMRQNTTRGETDKACSDSLENRATPILDAITKRLDALEGVNDSQVIDGPTPFGALWHNGQMFELDLTQLEVRLLNALWKPKQLDTERLCEDVYGQDDLKYSGIKDVKKRINKKFRESGCPLYLKAKGEFYHLIEADVQRNEEGEQQQ